MRQAQVCRISDAAVDAFFRGFRYMFCYKDLVKTLDSQVEKAYTEEERVSAKVAAERANGKLIKPHVDKWQKEAEEIMESAEKFAEIYKTRHSWRCIQCLPIPNPVSLFRLGRAVVQKTERLTELINSGKELLDDEIAHLAPAENLPKSNTEYQEFQSRKDVYAELWRTLITDSSPILGICGMPGVGKTRMMEQLWKEAQEKKIFNKVTRGNVGNENLDVIHLQKQIAEHLDCKFESEDNAESRASQLKQSLLNAGKTLVILDDVWREIPLDVIGIPYGDGNSPVVSKILMTSREENVCLRNNCNTLVKITPLRNDEAWEQFKNFVGTAQIDYMQDESLAKKVCDKCGGLPLLIHAVSKALQFETHNSWVDALEQLQKGEFVNIPGVEPQVYACVELSISKLHGDAKSCLFLCCLFPEDADIPIRELIQFATGSQLVCGNSRVLSMIDTLRLSSLLLDCEKDDRIKLHDLIRDVGRSIAFRDSKFAFSQVTCDVRLLDDADFVTTKFLRLDLDDDNIHIPDDLVCPNLHSLWIQFNNDIQQFSSGFFGMSANLRFLYLVGTYSPSKLQFSLRPLGKLRTLILKGCNLSHINNTCVGFFPENLETLCIWKGDFPEPLDLSNLKYLRKLEIKGSKVKMKPNTISSLSRLEELHIPDGLEIWRSESSDVQKPILVEINQLTRLKSLQIKFKISEPFQVTNIFDNLKLFNIRVGGWGSCVGKTDLSYKTSIVLQGCHEESLKSLIDKAEYVNLQCSNITMSSIFESNREAFTELRNLQIEECNKMDHLARTPHNDIQHSQQTSFTKLTYLEIIKCSGLRYLFCNSVAKCLTQLQKLIIRDCPVMEAIVIHDGSSNGDIIHFSKLEELELSNVPRLTGFCRENKDAMMQPSVQFQPLFHRMVEFPNLVELVISHCEEINLESIKFSSQLKRLNISCDEEIQLPSTWQPRLHNLETLFLSRCWSHELISSRFHRLKMLKVFGYSGGSALFTFSGFRSLQQLQELVISDCAFLQEIVEDFEMSGMNSKTITLSHLEIVVLKDLPKLKSIIHGANYGCRVPSLTYVEVEDCGLSNLFSFSELTTLETLKISRCAHLEEIVEDIRIDEVSGMNKKTITLSQLKQVILEDLPKLKSFIYSANHECLLLPNLSMVTVSDCGLSSLFTCSTTFGSLQRLENLLVRDCRMLEGIFEYARGDETSGTSEEIIISLPKLWLLELRNLPDLKSFIHGANYDFYMPALWEIKVDNCGFSTLFTCSVFRDLQNLFRLEVSNCKLLEVVVEDARGDETSGTNDKTITLPLLENIELEHLPNLKSFSGDESMAFNMLQLKNFSLVGCPGVENFTCLNTHTGNGYVRTDGDEWKQVPDLNDYIKSLFKKEDVAVPENQRDSKMKSLGEP
ncbi:hypothetical protein ACET3Z_000403 [Daucus carota]